MLPARRTEDGALYISTIAPQPTDIFKHGIAMTSDGVMRVDEFGVPSNFVGGFGVTDAGALCVNLSNAAIAGFHQGLPMDSVGNLVCQLNQPVSPGDQYIAGVRVGSLGGVYVVDTTPPPPDGFSSGFSAGFGA